VVHADSLGLLIADNRKRALGLEKVPRRCTMGLTHVDGSKIETPVWVFPLSEPPEAFLMIGNADC